MIQGFVRNFISFICDILLLDEPIISSDTSVFPTNTTFAMCDAEGKTIYLKPNIKEDYDLLFAIAHELRHVWQIRNDKSYFMDYAPSNVIRDTDTYNSQTAEIDANAFAAFILIALFGVQPQFNGLSEETKQTIFKHMESVIVAEFAK